ncbi:hypothetical protein SAMN05216548_105124 [Faunimonas pinastri]|uniref:SnoaL-like domain-containing protein n=1 Tax=Faunimonas pinastri TaxID=1855383 RepID=A0A1H9GRC1_9HYPH|nr:nuclear transport factor 2 family protein [Faunimonas pinastri]SEQ52593.1 hypothetical protein SAMN05216548_105124 [Faunimonas pinastri]
MTVTRERVREIFSGLEQGNGDAFFAHVADDVDWRVMGTHPLAGQYHDRDEFRARTFARIAKALTGPPEMRVGAILIDGDRAAVELRLEAEGRNGLRFDNRYCWIVRFRGEEIVEVRAYLDSALVRDLLGGNEA